MNSVGFGKISQVSDDLSAFSVSISDQEQVRIRCIDGKAEVNVFGITGSFFLERGFLTKLVSFAQEQLFIRQNATKIFAKIDSLFPTLAPDRHSSLLKRSIFTGRNCEPIKVRFEAPGFWVNNCPVTADEIISHLQAWLPSNLALFSSSDLECGICYSDYLDGYLADFRCANSACTHSYHRACLLSWFKANPTCQCNFNFYRGACLFCEQVILGSLF